MSDLAEKTVIGCLLMDSKELHQMGIHFGRCRRTSWGERRNIP